MTQLLTTTTNSMDYCLLQTALVFKDISIYVETNITLRQQNNDFRIFATILHISKQFYNLGIDYYKKKFFLPSEIKEVEIDAGKIYPSCICECVA